MATKRVMKRKRRMRAKTKIMKSIIVKFAVALASVAMLALFMWGFAEAFDAEMESHSKEYWERMEEER